MMNNEMMRQLQARMVKLQEDLASQTVEASAGGGGVTVTISEIGMGPAQAKVQRVKIAPEAVDPEDIETLEDLVVAAVNEPLSKAQKVAAEKVAPLARAVRALPTLPGIGPKTAQRLTFHLLRQPPEMVRGLAEALQHMKEAVHFCSVCGNVTDVEPCSICRSDPRDRSTICVVEDPLAVITLERTRIYKGLYHVLHGALDPLHGVTVEDLKIEELVRRVQGGGASDAPVQEVILATNPNAQ